MLLLVGLKKLQLDSESMSVIWIQNHTLFAPLFLFHISSFLLLNEPKRQRLIIFHYFVLQMEAATTSIPMSTDSQLHTSELKLPLLSIIAVIAVVAA